MYCRGGAGVERFRLNILAKPIDGADVDGDVNHVTTELVGLGKNITISSDTNYYGGPK